MTVTKFHDMHSGGNKKTEYGKIYIEALENDAIAFFKSWFGRDPMKVTCSCCGPDFSITTYESIEQATGYDRNCKCVDNEYIEEPRKLMGETRELLSVEEYLDNEDVAFFDHGMVEDELNRVVSL